MASDGGLTASMYGPNTVTTTVRGGAKVRIDTVTNYPFEETIRMDVTVENPATKTRRPEKTAASAAAAVGAAFTLHLRVPGWCKKASFAVNGVVVPTRADSNGYQVGTHQANLIYSFIYPSIYSSQHIIALHSNVHMDMLTDSYVLLCSALM
jgi:DUF1680 family protein